MADNATLARSLYEAWNNRDFDYSDNHVTAGTKLVDVGTGTTFYGPEGIRKFNTTWANAFPDGKITVDRVIETGDIVVVEYTGRGTHTGAFVTEMGTIPPTGKSVTLKVCDITEFAAGKVHEQHTYLDSGSLMTQLGLVPESSATTTTG
ncbi:MAG: ester cyclase [Nocardioidaceae bacterium]